MNIKSHTTLHPRDTSAAAIRAALVTLAQEREAAASRRALALEKRKAALRDPAAAIRDVVGFEQHARDADVELERLAILAEDFDARLAAAIQKEDTEAKTAAIEATRAAYAEATDALRAGLAKYVAAAEAIARVCAVEKARAVILGRFRTAVSQSLPPRSPAHPHLFDPGVEDLDASFLGDVVLPGLPGKPMIVGSLSKQNSQNGLYG